MSDLQITHLRCEYLVEPLGLDEALPRLSWQLDASRRGVRQVAYRIRVATTPEALGSGAPDLWDSGRVESDRTAHIVYAGRALGSRLRCHWDVEVWDETGASVRSQPSLWTMGLLQADDWTARWIAADPEIIARDPDAIAPTLTEPGTPALFRREFDLGVPAKRATLYATARGVFELRANGSRISDDRFAPEWTDYDKRIHYRTYDLTSMLVVGRNCLAATLGDGWWSGFVGWQESRARYDSLENSLLLQLEVELEDGKRLTIGSDGSWECNTGPILSSDFQMGETYDARRERAGWDSACPVGTALRAVRESASTNSDGSESRPYHGLPWLRAREIAPPSARLVAQRSEPIRVTEDVPPSFVTEHQPGVFIIDFGQNLTGHVRLPVDGLPAGTRVTIRHGERLNPDGSLYTHNLRRAKATDVYVANGAPRAAYEPHFTFHGFQYVELTASPAPCDDRNLRETLSSLAMRTVARVVHSATPPAGSFRCSHAGVNRVWLNGLWSQRDNFVSVPTDCPQRDERLGWMGDAQVFIRTATCNMDVAAFFTKWMTDVEDAQTADGIFPDVAPRIREDIRWTGLDGLGGGAGWADAGIVVPWTIWRVYGDTRIIERHFDAMVKWLEWIERHNPDHLRTRELGNNYGDWLCIPTDTSFRTHSPMKNLLATAYWADDAAKLARMAQVIGRETEAARFETMFKDVRAAFQQEFLREDGRLTVETQTAYLLALAFDLLPQEVRTRAAERLADNIKALDWHLSTGFIGISHLNPQLTLAGHADVAYRLLLQDSYPSWLYPVRHGATTIWERWDSWTPESGYHPDGMNSFNHYSLGSVGEWLFRHVAGIELDPEAPGFQRFVLRPFIGTGLDHAQASYRSMHGEIESRWKREGDALTWSVRVPPNTTARIHIPSVAETTVETDGLEIIGREGDFAVCEAPAGRYQFRSTWRIQP